MLKASKKNHSFYFSVKEQSQICHTCISLKKKEVFVFSFPDSLKWINLNLLRGLTMVYYKCTSLPLRCDFLSMLELKKRPPLNGIAEKIRFSLNICDWTNSCLVDLFCGVCQLLSFNANYPLLLLSKQCLMDKIFYSINHDITLIFIKLFYSDSIVSNVSKYGNISINCCCYCCCCRL